VRASLGATRYSAPRDSAPERPLAEGERTPAGRLPRRGAARLPRATLAPQPLLIAAFVLVLGLAAALGFAMVPQATIVLHPLAQPVSGTVQVRADPAIRSVDVSGRRVPARVSYVVVDVVEQALTRGRLPSPSARAVGSVTLANRAGGPVAVPAETIVMTPSGQRFRTTAEASLEAAAGSTARVPIEALEAGDRGNVARLEIGRLVGALASQVAVLNEEPTVGGGESTTPVVTDDDVARVRQLAADHARADALAKLQGDVGDDESLVLQTLDFTTLEEQVDRRTGDQTSSFNYRLRARVSGSIVDSKDVEQVVRQSWRPTVPDGYTLPPVQLQIGAPAVARVDDRALVLEVPVQSLAVAPVDRAAVEDRVRWRDPDEARRDVGRAFKWASDPSVAVTPKWAGRALRVKVVVDLTEPKRVDG
jgi:hypothetical protein